MNSILRVLRNDAGATAIEYGLIAALIAVAIISAVSTIAEPTVGPWETITNTLSGSSS